MYQIITHALSSPTNTTHFTLLFANVTPSDILLREEFDKLQKQYPNTLKIVYAVDKPEQEKNWAGEVGFVGKELLQKYVAPASLGEKVKVFICGPPGQVAAVAGKKDGMKQGAVGGVLKELGYTEDQVRLSFPPFPIVSLNDILSCRSSSSRFRYISYILCYMRRKDRALLFNTALNRFINSLYLGQLQTSNFLRPVGLNRHPHATYPLRRTQRHQPLLSEASGSLAPSDLPKGCTRGPY